MNLSYTSHGWRTSLARASAVEPFLVSDQESQVEGVQPPTYYMDRDFASAAATGVTAERADDLENQMLTVNRQAAARLTVALPPPNQANSASALGSAATPATDPDVLQTVNLLITPTEVESALTLAAHLRQSQVVPYAEQLASRIEAIVEDWPDDEDAPPPHVGSLNGLVTFFATHNSWARPRIYADSAGRFSAEWSVPSTCQLALQFLDANTVEFLYRPAAKPHPRWGRLSHPELEDQLAILHVDRWIGRANDSSLAS